jgi:hypothetical protein
MLAAMFIASTNAPSNQLHARLVRRSMQAQAQSRRARPCKRRTGGDEIGGGVRWIDGTKRDARGGGGVGGELECGLEREGGGWNTEALWPFCGRLSQGLSFQFKIAVRMQRWVWGVELKVGYGKQRWGWEGVIGSFIHTRQHVTATKKTWR